MATDWWNVSAAWITAIAATVYTGFTIWMVIETRRLRRAQTDPYVFAAIRDRHDDRDGGWHLAVENMGLGAAFDVCVEISPPDHPLRQHVLADSTLKLPFLGPGRRFVLLFKDDRRPESVDGAVIHATYRRALEQKQKIKTSIPAILRWHGRGKYEADDLQDVAQNITGLARNLDALTSAIKAAQAKA